jgi:hypothetical protein
MNNQMLNNDSPKNHTVVNREHYIMNLNNHPDIDVDANRPPLSALDLFMKQQFGCSNNTTVRSVSLSNEESISNYTAITTTCSSTTVPVFAIVDDHPRSHALLQKASPQDEIRPNRFRHPTRISSDSQMIQLSRWNSESSLSVSKDKSSLESSSLLPRPPNHRRTGSIDDSYHCTSTTSTLKWKIDQLNDSIEQLNLSSGSNDFPMVPPIRRDSNDWIPPSAKAAAVVDMQQQQLQRKPVHVLTSPSVCFHGRKRSASDASR